MISAIIATHESERPLVHTLAALVPGALRGAVREVIVADADSTDETAKVADLAGCNFLRVSPPRGACLAAGAAAARADWLLFLQPGSVPEPAWLEEAERFIGGAGNPDLAQAGAAVLRARPRRSGLAEAIKRTAAGLGALPHPRQGLLIAKRQYQSLGGHDAASADPERLLLRRLGYRRITVLDAVMAWRG
jgi:glycosyltransferase involved in cell wall biosynthesis